MSWPDTTIPFRRMALSSSHQRCREGQGGADEPGRKTYGASLPSETVNLDRLTKASAADPLVR